MHGDCTKHAARYNSVRFLNIPYQHRLRRAVLCIVNIHGAKGYLAVSCLKKELMSKGCTQTDHRKLVFIL